ncbi:MAG: hypothetical protein IPK19_39780 [Chloroflexi bacterium]|nr:hypothetical protein [Chloroflexota bacterium]
MADPLQAIRNALQDGDKKKAVQLLRPLLQQPTADVWVLTSRAAATPEQSIDCLRRALALDPLHTEANRLLFRLEGALPQHVGVSLHAPRSDTPAHISSNDRNKRLAPLKGAKARKPVNRGEHLMLMLTFAFLAGLATVVALNMLGVVSGPIALMTSLAGGPQPVREIDGRPLGEVEDAVVRVGATQSEPAQPFDVDVLDTGYLHEYTFPAATGETVAVTVQFLSLYADRVSRNVALVGPGGIDITASCQRDVILGRERHVTMLCTAPEGGPYALRVLGRQGESVGVYWINLERMDWTF